MNKKNNPELYDKKLKIVVELIRLGKIDNRVFN